MDSLLRDLKFSARSLLKHQIRGSVAPGNFTDWREQNQTCEQLVAIQQKSFDLSDGAHPERFPGYGVTQGFFDALGVKAERGRTFLPEESEPGHEQVVVLKHSFWQQHLGGDPNIVGKTITLNRKVFTVVGVMPADFNYPYNGWRDVDAARFRQGRSAQSWQPLFKSHRLVEAGRDHRPGAGGPARHCQTCAATVSRNEQRPRRCRW